MQVGEGEGECEAESLCLSLYLSLSLYIYIQYPISQMEANIPRRDYPAGGIPWGYITILDIGHWIFIYIQSYANIVSFTNQLHIRVHASQFSQSGEKSRYTSIHIRNAVLFLTLYQKRQFKHVLKKYTLYHELIIPEMQLKFKGIFFTKGW